MNEPTTYISIDESRFPYRFKKPKSSDSIFPKWCIHSDRSRFGIIGNAIQFSITTYITLAFLNSNPRRSNFGLIFANHFIMMIGSLVIVLILSLRFLHSLIRTLPLIRCINPKYTGLFFRIMISIVLLAPQSHLIACLLLIEMDKVKYPWMLYILPIICIGIFFSPGIRILFRMIGWRSLKTKKIA